MAKDREGYSGVWRTIRGAHVFIRDGEDLESAMKRSGKFKTKFSPEETENLRKAGREARAREIDKINATAFETYGSTDEDIYQENIKEEKDKYATDYDFAKSRHIGFGEFNKDGIPVYDNKIDNKGDFGYADLSKLSNEELKEALNVQSQEYKNATNERLGDQRTRNGKMDKIFNTAKKQKYEEGMKLLNEEMEKRDLPRYNIYDDAGNIRVSSPTKEMAERELAEMYETDKSLQKSYGWKELPKYSIKEGKVDEYLNERKDETVKLPDGTPIDQNYVKDLYSGMSYEEVKRENDFDKEWMANVKPEAKAMQMAKVRETDKYLDSMERYESRISDEEYGKKDWGDGVYPFSEGTAWKGTKSGERLSTKEIAKAVTDKMKEAYPGVKIGRSTSYYSGGSSADFYITASDKPIVRDISDFSDTEISRLYNKGYNSNWYKTEGEFKEHLQKELTSGHFDVNKYYIDDDYRLTPYGKQVIKDLSKVSDAYNYDESDGMTDYFNTGFYSDISVGRYNKPFVQGNNGEVKAKVERFKERKGKSNSLENLSKRELAEKLVENQMSRGMSFNNKENVIKSKMKMTKEELLKYFK